MKQCKLIIRDEVNIKFDGLDPPIRRKLEKELKFFLPYAYHVPSYKLGRWDGCVSFFTVGGMTFLNLLDRILPFLNHYDIEIEDKREPFDFKFDPIDKDHFSEYTWPKKHTAAGQPIVLRDYQVEVINKFLKSPHALQEVATGAGKTLITASLSNLIEPWGRSIVIVPNKSLVKQTEADYKALGLDTGVYFGDRKDFGHTHMICTWQSLNIMEKRFRDGLSDVSIIDFAEDVICVIVDEAHMVKADVLKKLLTSVFAKVPLRWGLTGTIPKEEHEQVSLKASIGDVIHRLGAAELQDKGVLANCEVNIIQLEETAVYKNYQSELSYLVGDKQRLDYMAGLIKSISESGNTLVLIDRIKTGKGLTERVDTSVFISGSVKTDERREHYDEIQDSDNKIIIATYGVASVGINIPRIFNLVLVESGKSFVRVIQSIGRGIRKAEDKDFVQIWDITSTAKFSKRHLAKRKKFYNEAKYPFNINKVNYRC